MKIVVNNLVTEYLDEGAGPIIVMLHGWGVDLHSFDKLSNKLSPKYRIVRVDLPGFGGTDLPKSWKLDDYINFVSSFIEKLDIKPDVLLGHSFGGRIIIKGVGNNKLKANKIILVSPAGVSLFNLKKTIIRYLSKMGKLFLYVPPIYFWKENIKKMFYKSIGSGYMDNRNMKEIFGSVVSEDLEPYAKNIKQKTLLVWGDRDYVTPLSDGKFLNKVLSNSNLEIIKNAGHFSFVERPEEVVRLIEDFIM